jgi:hypothetical protein
MQNRRVKDGSRVCGRTSHAASVLCLALRILHGSLYWGGVRQFGTRASWTLFLRTQKN